MSPLEKAVEGGAPVMLLPHQANFVEAVLGAEGKRVTLLRGDVGLGKSTTLVSLASRLLQEQPTARSLFLVPAALRLQFVDTLRKVGAPALLVDRYQYREMVDSASGNEFWPTGVVAVLSPEFARQADILERLASTLWDLVVADEAHSMRGARAELLRRVGVVAKRLVLTSASSISLPDGFSSEDFEVVQWWRDQLVDREGRPLDVVPRPALHEVPFDLSQSERSLADTVGELGRVLGDGTPEEQWRAKSVLRCLRSSPAALEARLLRLASAAEPLDSGASADVTGDEEEAVGGGAATSVGRPTAEQVSGIVGRALQEIAAIQIDSKAVAFGALLTRLIEAKRPATRICVPAEFLATCYYLVAEIEGRGLACHLLHGGMGWDDRHGALTKFSATGGILVTTRAVMAEGINLSHVTDLVLYDVPSSREALQQVLGRVDRFGRLSQLNVHALVPLTSTGALGFEPLHLLRGALLGHG